MRNKTYHEGGKYYAVLWSTTGQSYYEGGYASRSTARRHALKRQPYYDRFDDRDERRGRRR